MAKAPALRGDSPTPAKPTAASGGKIDLTTPAGLAAAAALLAGGGATAAVMAPMAAVAGPLALLAVYFTRAGQTARQTMPTSDAPQARPIKPYLPPKGQAEVAIAILKAGKELGLENIEFDLESDVGVDIGAHLPKSMNIDLKLKVGRNNKTTVRAKYKDA